MTACPSAIYNPPLPFSPKAVVAKLQHQANNGPPYIQHQATNALARILGLYDQTKDLAKRLAEPILGEPETNGKPKKKKLTNIQKVRILQRGGELPSEDDEEEGGEEDADPL